ncbi:hypothetical protein EPUS_08017 [Endocarpon pusillum Z07020]|uniref:Uncharacterized protein n=1 Tax=Endocarpon pusillum (strain Z07020 / HMAS-L-300199) TaxID=1263415 RepID=U1GDM2_ENDPU|nr:uncharacterized protein EPUS_08017 [Endocarpon pusillum Z07020]ERF69816.1 hypothetical protein EPUS_08017 [Endocarpon pusillum Z07020]
MSSNLMDTVPGGETPQYESIKTVDKPTETQSGQLGGKMASGSSEVDEQKQEKGEQTAENVRYGQNISESGMGGMTTTSEGTASQGGYGGAEAQEGEEKPAQTRREQGYGPGSGVGA